MGSGPELAHPDLRLGVRRLCHGRQTPAVEHFDSGTYGRSFADVYDEWYPADATTGACVRFLSELAGPGGSVLELGVGTGRLALPLATSGHDVTGIDSSEAMLAELRDKDPRGLVRTVLGDIAGDMAGDRAGHTAGDRAGGAGLPSNSFAVVAAVCNLICNVVDPTAQAACIAAAARSLRPGGHLVVEAFEPAPLVAGAQLAASEVRGDAVVLIATDTDPATRIVTGQHVELRDGEPVRLRPWRIRVTTPEEIDRWATAAGLEPVERLRSWGVDGPPSDGLVSLYRRPPV